MQLWKSLLTMLQHTTPVQSVMHFKADQAFIEVQAAGPKASHKQPDLSWWSHCCGQWWWRLHAGPHAHTGHPCAGTCELSPCFRGNLHVCRSADARRCANAAPHSGLATTAPIFIISEHAPLTGHNLYTNRWILLITTHQGFTESHSSTEQYRLGTGGQQSHLLTSSSFCWASRPDSTRWFSLVTNQLNFSNQCGLRSCCVDVTAFTCTDIPCRASSGRCVKSHQCSAGHEDPRALHLHWRAMH